MRCVTPTVRTRCRAVFAALLFALAACGGAPPVRYYQLAAPESAEASGGDVVLAVEQLTADAAFEDQRMVYRTSPYRVDYYYYHRWSAPPSLLVTDYLRMAYARTGRFRAVVSGYTPEATAVLTGRVLALEEVDGDQSDGPWRGRVRLELALRDGRSGELLWSRTLSEEEPVESRSPEGVAQALTRAVARIVESTAPEIAGHANR
jgi:ABC-type uncharacterized transport system auxiliary subunit